MQIGIDSFAAAFTEDSLSISASDRLQNLIEEIALADKAGLDSFGIGEHHRREFLDSAPPSHSRGCSSKNTKDPSHQRRNSPQRHRPSTYLSRIRNPRPIVQGPSRNGRRQRLVNRSLSIIRFSLGGLRLTICGEARPPPKNS